MSEGGEGGGVLRKLLAVVGFEVDEKSEKGVEGAIEGVKHLLVTLGEAFAAKEIYEAIEGTVDAMAHAATEAEHMAQRLGISAEAYQKLGYVAKTAGVSQEEMGASLRVLQKNAFEASRGNEKMIDNFYRLGVSVTDSNGHLKTAEQLFAEAGDGLAKLKDPTMRTALAQEVLGRSGTALLPVLMKGSAAIKEQQKHLEELGAVMDEDFIARSKELEEAEIDQAAAMQGVKIAFTRDLIPVFARGKREMTEFLAKTVRPLAAALGKSLAKAILRLKELFHALQEALRPVADWLAKFTESIFSFNKGADGAITLVEVLTAVITGLAALLAAKAIAMAISWAIANAPLLLTILLIGIIALAIGALIEDWLEYEKTGGGAIGTIVNGFKALVDEVGSIPAAIAEMLKTAVDYWFDFSDNVKNLVHALIDFVINQFAEFGNFVESLIYGDLKGAFGALAQSVGDTLGIVGKIGKFMLGGNIESGDMGPKPAQGNTVVTGNLNSTVNAVVTGVSTPDQAGSAMGQHVGAAMENGWRSMNQSYTYGPAPAGG